MKIKEIIPKYLTVGEEFDDFARATDKVDFSKEDLCCYVNEHTNIYYWLNTESVWGPIGFVWDVYEDYGHFSTSTLNFSIIPKIPDSYRHKKIYGIFQNINKSLEFYDSGWEHITEPIYFKSTSITLIWHITKQDIILRNSSPVNLTIIGDVKTIKQNAWYVTSSNKVGNSLLTINIYDIPTFKVLNETYCKINICSDKITNIRTSDIFGIDTSNSHLTLNIGDYKLNYLYLDTNIYLNYTYNDENTHIENLIIELSEYNKNTRCRYIYDNDYYYWGIKHIDYINLNESLYFKTGGCYFNNIIENVNDINFNNVPYFDTFFYNSCIAYPKRIITLDTTYKFCKKLSILVDDSYNITLYSFFLNQKSIYVDFDKIINLNYILNDNGNILLPRINYIVEPSGGIGRKYAFYFRNMPQYAFDTIAINTYETYMIDNVTYINRPRCLFTENTKIIYDENLNTDNYSGFFNSYLSYFRKVDENYKVKKDQLQILINKDNITHNKDYVIRNMYNLHFFMNDNCDDPTWELPIIVKNVNTFINNDPIRYSLYHNYSYVAIYRSSMQFSDPKTDINKIQLIKDILNGYVTIGDSEDAKGFEISFKNSYQYLDEQNKERLLGDGYTISEIIS